jgi:hypothetical protein
VLDAQRTPRQSPSAPGRSSRHITRGLRQALTILGGAVVLGLAAAAVWVGVAGGAFANRLGISLLVLAGLLALTGSSLIARLSTNEARAFLGKGPERDQTDLVSGLGPVGGFVFVTVPLAVVGLVLAS